MKSFLRFLLFVIWAVSFCVFVFVFSISRTALSQEYLKKTLVQKDFYNHLHASIPAITGYFETSSEGSGELNNVTPEQLGRIIVGATEPNILKSKTEQLITDSFIWMASEKNENPNIKISDLKNALMGSQANVLDVPLELLESGDFGIKFPDKIDVPLPNSFKNAQYIIANQFFLTYGSLSLALLSLTAFVLLKTGGVGLKIHSFGETFFWTGLVSALFFGFFWGFFTASGSLASGITSKFKIPDTEIKYFYGLVYEVITDYTVITEVFCLTVLVIGLVAWIASRFMINKTVAQPVPEKQEATA